jgi:hypothetical protein
MAGQGSSRDVLLCAALLLSSGSAAAEESGPPRQLTLRPIEDASTATEQAASDHRGEQRAFAYLLDPTTPARGDASLEYGVGLSPGVAADRPLPAALVAPASAGELAGITHSITAGYGVTDRLAPFVTGRATFHEDRSRLGGAAGARYQLTDPAGAFRLTVAGAALRESAGGLGAYARLAASYDLGRLRIAGNLHVERVFQQGRDPLDLLVMAGASYRTLDRLRVGVEYVGQDLEEASEGSHGAEGGARHYAGPTLALDLGHAQLVGGPAFELSEHAPRPVGRASMLVTF